MKNIPNKPKYRFKQLKKFLPFYLMMLPGILYLIINNYIPMFGIVMAFKKFDYKLGMFKSPGIGFKNFEFLFATKDAWTITRNTLAYNAVFIILGTLVSIAVAILLNEIRADKAKKLYQTVILIPFLISIVVVSYIVYGFLNSQTGYFNQTLLPLFGAKPISWYSEPKYWPIILVIVQLWKSFGYNCIIYYATLVGIDKGYYEAAVIDGAGRFQQIRYITLPGLKVTVITLTLMAIGRIFYSDFGLFYQVPMNSGVLVDVTNTIDTYVYRGLTQLNNLGMAAAAGFYQSVIGFLLVLSANGIVRKFSKENALF
ncbi:putative aldouronate transport system permease protein [Anaerocolumna jejuensis DSM 15929]|jgi:putative aldouronate transport system permease protein|uniref:Putative aldouronate transport system permease protein n=1 Tax=Anaerocolumna jejuensis DSM 15929 TaxID=1121322 RepID=A0A1M6ZWP1_9FIRM|nr:ABC transporter permease subunit [Anaerocolumna jejuensis]SHL34844.1 putative aldouronate transport system permease protein [Anaerocolumna jejuensis DSM 15929]